MPEELRPKPPVRLNTKRIETPVARTTVTPTTTPIPTTTNPRDLDRNRAMYAWENIQSVKSTKFPGKYGSLARKMPTLIQVNGLAQTLAYLKAKGKENDPKIRKEHFVQAFDHLSNWICNNRLNSGTGDLLARVLVMDSQTYRYVTNEALAFLQWLKRFAEAELATEDENQ